MANDSKGYYKAFGIPAGSDIKLVKKTYKAKQGELHPNGATRRKIRNSPEYQKLSQEEKDAKEKQFDEEISKINLAYSVIGDEEKKKQYDEGTGEYGAFSGFSGFSGGFGGFEDLFSNFTGQSRQRTPKTEDTVTNLNITLKESYTGKVTKFKINSLKPCKPCSGKGYAKVTKCSTCGGRGSVIIQRNLGLMVTRQEVPCDKCRGEGEIGEGAPCAGCKGQKVVKEPFVIEVNIYAGIKNGTALKFTGKGSQSPGSTPGDVIFKINVADDPNFRRSDDNLVGSVDVDLLTALSGGVAYFDHLDGRKLAVNIQPITNFKDCIKLSAEGFKNGNRKGDLFIELNVKINKNLSRSSLSSVIPPLVNKPEGAYQSINGAFSRAPEANKGYSQEDSDDDYAHSAHSFFRGFGGF